MFPSARITTTAKRTLSHADFKGQRAPSCLRISIPCLAYFMCTLLYHCFFFSYLLFSKVIATAILCPLLGQAFADRELQAIKKVLYWSVHNYAKLTTKIKCKSEKQVYWSNATTW